MKISNVELKVSAIRRSQYPEDGKPEFLLVGEVMLVKVVLSIR